ncbi:trace amine-associated receptor 13c-like [Pangasianodon hypophthalmus]|uniref:trace amine-associated receptor 13c-like n=1 Tax=Pangasianodon hypophthalmus TaxID=310915 RepID=UPI00147A66E4|nr:trace amine-associated receptor 13c-like [Pangasianodon hypophthalmus]
MNTTKFQQNLTDEYCYPDNNNSCRKEVQSSSSVFLFLFLSCLSVSTVILNLLVIISISHFKQLHTPTNLLIMSLAVADLLVGLIVMPVNIMDLIDNCWYLGKTMCSLYPVVNYISVSASAGSLVFIAVDRYIAVNNPLLYSTQITICKTSLSIVLTWSCAILYNTLFYFFNGHLLHPDMFSKCVGECVVVQTHSASVADLFISFIGPCFAMLFFYLRIFKVARYQVKSINALDCDNAHGRGVKSVKNKAVKTLGIVIFVYLSCWIPYYLNSLSTESLSSMSVVWIVVNWLIYINSSINPLIYAIFYPWFRASVKYILTCRIFHASSSMFNLFPEPF